ncbi:hypothetical protein F5X96DRAFT_671359 [Biscogniauxia mediterranea]|nr:hypothetical protein F5X96DRAFT_671359 [Biscogniauxia mediterranea]
MSSAPNYWDWGRWAADQETSPIFDGCLRRDISNYLSSRYTRTEDIVSLIQTSETIGAFQNTMQFHSGLVWGSTRGITSRLPAIPRGTCSRRQVTRHSVSLRLAHANMSRISQGPQFAFTWHKASSRYDQPNLGNLASAGSIKSAASSKVRGLLMGEREATTLEDVVNLCVIAETPYKIGDLIITLLSGLKIG